MNKFPKPLRLKNKVWKCVNYYAFGSPMPGRSFNSTEYSFGFQGQLKTDEISGAGNHIDFKYRGYNPRIGRFWSLDPLAAQYPHNSPYAFSENRVIDGIELEGLEYVTANVYIQKGKVLDIKLTTDYELKNKNTKGAGFQRNYIYLDSKGKIVKKLEGTEKNGGFIENTYGLYGGKDNPQLPEKGGNPRELKDFYGARALDEADEIFKQHDIDFDQDNLRGEEGVEDPQSTPYNNAVIDRADKLIDSYFKEDRNDIVTGKPIKTKTAIAAKGAKEYFIYKEEQKIEKNGEDK